MKTVFITVVRNEKMYNDFVKNNRYNKGAEFVAYDNTKENIYIPKRYNDFLDHYDYKDPAWFVFCHEDWQTKSDWLYNLDKLNKKSLYGICGTKLILRKNRPVFKHFYGKIIGSNKRGLMRRILGAEVKTGTVVDAFDCMCLIIHSSLVEKYHIRFDEKLTWHLYTEELCIRLKEKYNIPSRILQICSQHWSWGEANEEFNKSFDYLIQKFGKTKNTYSFTCSDKTITPTNQFATGVENPENIEIQYSLFGIPVWTRYKYADNLNKIERTVK